MAKHSPIGFTRRFERSLFHLVPSLLRCLAWGDQLVDHLGEGTPQKDVRGV